MLPQLRVDLQAAIPTGAAHNANVSRRVEEKSLWQQDLQCGLLTNRLKRVLIRQFASLGGGNHFLELQEDTGGCAWFMLHSGSRSLRGQKDLVRIQTELSPIMSIKGVN